GERQLRCADAPLERTAPEVVPEAREPSALALERRELCARLRMQRLRGLQCRLRTLTACKLLAVVLREVGAPLAVLLLARQIGEEGSDQLATALPQAAQLVEHERRIGGLGDAQAPLERVEHLLGAQRGALLLFDQVLETKGLFLQIAIGLFQLRAVAEQGQHPMVFFERDVGGTQVELEKA